MQHHAKYVGSADSCTVHSTDITPLIFALAARNRTTSGLDADHLGRRAKSSTQEAAHHTHTCVLTYTLGLVSRVTRGEMFDMVDLGRWIVGKVCQGHHIFRDGPTGWLLA